MSKGKTDRHGPIIAFSVTICFLIFALIGWYEGFKRGQESHQELSAAAYTEGAEDKIQKTCLALSDAAQAECISEAIGSSREEQRAEEDLDAQQQMAEWARWMLMSTVVMAVVTTIGVVFVWQTLEATRQMADDTKRIGVHQVRAYLFVQSADIIIDLEKSGHYKIAISLKNFGASPARRIRRRWVQYHGEQASAVEAHPHFSAPQVLPELPPGHSTTTSFELNPSIVSEIELAKKAGKLLQYRCCGVILYQDIFGMERKEYFSYRTSPGESIYPRSLHLDEDGNYGED